MSSSRLQGAHHQHPQHASNEAGPVGPLRHTRPQRKMEFRLVLGKQAQRFACLECKLEKRPSAKLNHGTQYQSTTRHQSCCSANEPGVAVHSLCGFHCRPKNHGGPKKVYTNRIHCPKNFCETVGRFINSHGLYESTMYHRDAHIYPRNKIIQCPCRFIAALNVSLRDLSQ